MSANKKRKEDLKKLALEQIKESGTVDQHVFFELKNYNLIDWYLKQRGLKEGKQKKVHTIKDSPRKVSDKQLTFQNQRLSLQYVNKIQYKICKNAIHLNAQNSDAHELMKYMICRQLNKEGKDFLTEVIFENGKRADILCLDTHIIYEVIVSETEKSQKSKTQNYYPKFFDVTFINGMQEWDEKIIH